ncbi:hypothetical protein LTR08_009275 [Meristemomyces frigidus]|nr:hypothetical protein LTR08_009275 [Meristemomyces frigidus]
MDNPNPFYPPLNFYNQDPPTLLVRLRALVNYTLSLIFFVPRYLLALLLAHQTLYLVSIHDRGHPQTRPAHTRTFGLYTTATAARVALTQVIALPEYEGRPMWFAYPELGERESGAMVMMHDCGGGGGDGGIVGIVETMSVRSGGL